MAFLASSSQFFQDEFSPKEEEIIVPEPVWRSVDLEESDGEQVGAQVVPHDMNEAYSQLDLGPRKPNMLQQTYEAFTGEATGEPLANKKSLYVPHEPAVAVVAMEVKDEPCYVNPWSSFVCSSLPLQLLQEVTRILNSDTSTDCELQLATASLRALKYCPDGSSVSLKLQVYRRGDESYLVEVSRRRGCILAFHGFYRDILSQLGESHVKCKLADEQTAPCVAPEPVLPAEAQQEHQEQHEHCKVLELPRFLQVTEESLLPTFKKAKEEPQECVRTLALVAEDERNFGAVVAPTHIDSLLELLDSTVPEDGDCGRCASTLVANLVRVSSADRPTVQRIANRMLPLFLARLAAPDTLETRGAKRIVAGALASLSDRIPLEDWSELRSYHDELRSILRSSTDARVHTQIEHTLRRISA